MYETYQQCKNQLDDVQAIDYFLARQICKELKLNSDELLFHSIIACSQALRHGHSCLKIAAFSDENIPLLFAQIKGQEKSGYLLPNINDWHDHLHDLAISVDDKQPLVYEHKRLYLRRYWQFEHQLSIIIKAFIAGENDTIEPFKQADSRQVIKQLFPLNNNASFGTIDWQKLAVANALLHPFSIITGGPGTGKTFTVTKVLAALQMLSNNRLKIAMLAPTGKAAQRLNESIQKAKTILSKHSLVPMDTLDSIPDAASTIHRLLGVLPGSHDFRYNSEQQLVFDVILVDEISMIDLPLMTRLMRAISSNCRIIMLGDADQLPSVAAGSVLSDLAPVRVSCFSAGNIQQLSKLTGHSDDSLSMAQANKTENGFSLDYLTVLQHSHRFDGQGEIGHLANMVINGQVEHSWEYLLQANQQIEYIKNDRYRSWIERLVEQYYMPLFSLNDGQPELNIEQAFSRLGQFRFLAATRSGEQGVAWINDYIEQILRRRSLIVNPNNLYHGRPVMVTENHYHLGLYNGDTGLLWLNNDSRLQAVFPYKDGWRYIALGRLPQVETVYAMTIHKTQGSEFAHVALVLPDYDSPILSRELIYTGITRASEQLSVFSSEGSFKQSLKRKIERYSGLSKKILR